MSLKDRITEDMKAAMRSGEKDRLGLIRLLQAGIKQREVDERITLDDAQVWLHDGISMATPKLRHRRMHYPPGVQRRNECPSSLRGRAMSGW